MSEHRCGTCEAQTRCAFSHLPRAAKQELARLSRSFTYSAGFPVYRQDDAARGIHIVRSGWVKQSFNTESGKGAAVALSGPGSVLGLAQLLSGAHHPVGATVVRAAELAYVEGRRFLAFLEDHPRLNRRLLRSMSREQARLLRELCESAGKVPSEQRLLHVLQGLAAECGVPREEGLRIPLRLTVQDLAERIGCSRQWTSRLVAELEEQGALRRRRGWWTLTPDGAAGAGGGPGARPAR